MEVDRDSLISSFVAVTGVDPDRGQLYLEATGWNLDLSIQTFYEESDETAAERNANVPALNVTSQPSLPEAEQAPNLASLLRQPPVSMSGPPGNSGHGSKKKQPPVRGGIATLGSLRNQEDSSDDDDKQAFYAGGSERSGQQVLGPSGKKRNPDEVVSEMFKAAKEHGGQVVGPSEAQGKKKLSFGGQGFRLGSESGVSNTVSTAAAVGLGVEPTGLPAPREMVLRLWRNGFTVDDSALRAFDDPENADFLQSIRSGNIPRELITLARGGEVSLNMEDHRAEEFVPTKKKMPAFAGEGHRLGAVAPVTSNDSPACSAVGDEAKAKENLAVDEAKPTTNIQVRLADSSR